MEEIIFDMYIGSRQYYRTEFDMNLCDNFIPNEKCKFSLNLKVTIEFCCFTVNLNKFCTVLEI